MLISVAVQQEKTHQNLLNVLNGVEHFDKSSMKHTTTAEKVVLPDSKGRYAVLFREIMKCL